MNTEDITTLYTFTVVANVGGHRATVVVASTDIEHAAKCGREWFELINDVPVTVLEVRRGDLTENQ